MRLSLFLFIVKFQQKNPLQIHKGKGRGGGGLNYSRCDKRLVCSFAAAAAAIAAGSSGGCGCVVPLFCISHMLGVIASSRIIIRCF